MILTRIAGSIVLAALMLALSNFFLKQISRDYVKRLPASYKDFADAYRRFMQKMVRRHRFFGLAALLILPLHAALAVVFAGISLSGLATAALLVAVAGLGMYGYYLNRNLRAWWLSVHRALAFAVSVSALVHVFFKLYL